MYYKKLKDKDLVCSLCPHACKLKDGEKGICRVRKNIDGKLYSLNYGKIASYGYDRIEKKPLYNFHPGKTIFSIGSFGCNLACDFCQNWEIAQEEARTIEIDDREIIKLAKSKGSIGIAYTYNEPSIWYEYVLDLSKKAKKAGLINVLVTNGYINQEPLEELLPHIDAMSIDLKSISDDFYRDICKGRLEPVLDTIERAADQVHIELVNLVIDSLNSSIEEIETIAKTIGKIDRTIPLHLSRYFPAYKMKLAATRVSTVKKAAEIARQYLDNVYLGNIF